MTISFRNFRPTDKRQLQEMIFSLYKEDPEGESIDKLKINRTVEILSSYPEKGSIIIFDNQGIVAGYAILINYWSNEYGGDILNIDELYVKPQYRRSGYATEFMKYVFKQYENSCSGFMLEVTPDNTQAYQYYKRLGFKETTNRHMIKD